MNPAKTAAVIHDLSGIGRCALTVVLPVLSAMGVQACPVPTAVMSTHTGGFTDIISRDMTDILDAYVAHWRALGLEFDAVYSGYLANPKQARTVEALMELGAPLTVIDPVMGDDGRMYSSLTPDMAEAMRALCRRADVITPNRTEAALLLGEAYSREPMSEAEIRDMCAGLLKLGAKNAVVTSLSLAGGGMANACASRDGLELNRFESLPAHYPGTGDLFASVLTGRMLAGAPLSEAVKFAGKYVYDTIKVTIEMKTEVRMGVQLEKTLFELILNTECAKLKGSN